MIVNEIMTKKLVTVKADDTLSQAASLMRQHQIPGFSQASSKEIPESRLIASGRRVFIALD